MFNKKPAPIKTPSFHLRPFIALVMLSGFILVGVSALILYFGPSWREATQTGWTLLWFDRASWTDIHIAFGFLWLAAGLFHIWLNRKPVQIYAKTKGWPEWTSVLVLSVLLFVGAVLWR